MASEDQELDAILNRDFTSRYRRGYVNVEGFTMGERYLEMKENIDNMDVKEDDVWICSFPKTGTTWTQEMVWMIMNNLDFVGAQVNLSDRSPFLEISSAFDYKEMMNTVGDPTPPSLEDSFKYTKEMSEGGTIAIKTHLPWTLLPRSIKEGIKRPKIIYVTRNPKDTCFSYFNHCQLIAGYKGNFEDFCRLFLAGKLPYAPYWDHILQYWERRNQMNIRFLKYEDMIKDLPSIIKQVANFLERPLSTDQVSLLANHLSFESMKANPAVNYDILVNFSIKYKVTNETEGNFLRYGKVGSYKIKMTDENVKKFDEKTEINTRDTDFSF